MQAPPPPPAATAPLGDERERELEGGVEGAPVRDGNKGEDDGDKKKNGKKKRKVKKKSSMTTKSQGGDGNSERNELAEEEQEESILEGREGWGRLSARNVLDAVDRAKDGVSLGR